MTAKMDLLAKLFLLAPLREGRLGGKYTITPQTVISTRAPTRGATSAVHP